MISWQYLVGYLTDSKLESLMELAFLLLLPGGQVAFIENKPPADEDEGFDDIQKYQLRSLTKLLNVAEKFKFQIVGCEDTLSRLPSEEPTDVVLILRKPPRIRLENCSNFLDKFPAFQNAYRVLKELEAPEEDETQTQLVAEFLRQLD